MEAVYQLDDEDKRKYNEFIQCVQKGKRSYGLYAIGAGLTAGLLYNPKGQLLQVGLKRLGAAFLGYAVCSGVTTYISMVSCEEYFANFIGSVKNKSGIEFNVNADDNKYSHTPTGTENISHSSDFNFPSNISDDTSSFKENIYEEKEKLTLPKKPVTYTDLWDSRHDSVESRLLEEKPNTGKPAVTSPTKPVATNKYGDPLE